MKDFFIGANIAWAGLYFFPDGILSVGWWMYIVGANILLYILSH